MSKLLVFMVLLFLCFALAGGALATDFFGGAGPTPMYLAVDYGDLNGDIEGIGVAPVENGSFLMGWSFYLYVHPSVRVGMMGAGGSKREEGKECNITREARVGLGFIGATGEYVFSFMKGDVAVGTMLGWGHADIELRQTLAGPIDWDDIWNGYRMEPATAGNFGTTLKGNFFAYQPFLRLKYKLTGWLSLQGSVGYLGAEVNKWKQWGDVDIKNDPSLDLGGIVFTLGPHLGF